MTKDKKAFKCAAITETAVCELYHIRFVFKDIVSHVKIYLKDIETVQSLYKIKTFNSIIIRPSPKGRPLQECPWLCMSS